MVCDVFASSSSHPHKLGAYSQARSPVLPNVTVMGGARARQARWAAAIPRFYFPGGRPVPDEVLAASAARVDSLLGVYSGGLTIPGMKQLVKEVRCGAACAQTRPLPVLSRASCVRGEIGRHGVLHVTMGTWSKGLGGSACDV